MKEHTHLFKDQNQVRVVGKEGANDFNLLPEGDNAQMSQVSNSITSPPSTVTQTKQCFI